MISTMALPCSFCNMIKNMKPDFLYLLIWKCLYMLVALFRIIICWKVCNLLQGIFFQSYASNCVNYFAHHAYSLLFLCWIITTINLWLKVLHFSPCKAVWTIRADLMQKLLSEKRYVLISANSDFLFLFSQWNNLFK